MEDYKNKYDDVQLERMLRENAEKEEQLQSVMIKKLVIKIQRKMQHKRHYLGF